MPEVVNILFGAVFTVAVCLAMGSLLLARLRLTLFRIEATLFAFITGAACLSFSVTMLAFVHLARRGVFLWGGLAVIGLAVWRAKGTARRRSLPAVALDWLVPFYLLFIAFFIYYFVNALAPEISPDGSGYHLGNVVRMWRANGFDWQFRSMYAYLSQGMEMLFLVAFTFGRHSAAALVHFAFLVTLPLLMVCYGQRFGNPKLGLFGALVVWVSPIVAKDGVSAYNDLTVATLIYAVFYLLQVWDEERSGKLLFLCGLLCGFAYAVKYTAFLVLPFAVTWVWWKSAKLRVRNAAVLILAAMILVAPWVLRNWFWVGNPFAPFLNAWFPNPYYHAGMERIYAELLGKYLDLKHNWEIPLQLTVRGAIVGGTFGPVFLLTPLALLAWRFKFGRPLLIAAVVFAIPNYFNTGSRFLIPAAPFVAMSLGVALSEVPWALPALALFQAFLCWPTALSTYCDPWSWRISTFPIAEALREAPPGPYIAKSIGDYALKRVIEGTVKPKERIFSFAGRPEAYIDREIVVAYESSLGNLAQDILLAPQGHAPNSEEHFKFLPIATRAVRVVNNTTAPAFWTVAEMRIRLQGREVPRAASWKLRAWPNPDEVQLAFDNSYATRWSTWEGMAPHARIEVEFPAPQTIDEVVLECEPAWEALLQIEVRLDSGRWVPLTDTQQVVKGDFPTGIRRAAMREVKALGFQYLLLNDGDYVYQDIRKYPGFWGVTQIAEDNGTHLFHID